MAIQSMQGLSAELAARRLKEEGSNELSVSQRRSSLDIVWEVVREPMFLLLIGAGAIYLVLGDPKEAAILLGFVVLIMGITVFQERRTDNTLNRLRDLSSPRAKVVRGGEVCRIPGAEVVREDILLLAEGDRIPADGRVLESHELATDESMLTGESVEVNKQAPADRVFAGTMVVRGQGIVAVEAIGNQTELGKIGRSLGDISMESSPLRAEVSELTQRLLAVGAGLCFVLVLLFWALRGDLLHAFLAGITLAMGILPQEFPVILIVFMALGARRMAMHQVLTRRLNAIEVLGETTVLCVDKTGTLTQNRMALVHLSVGGVDLDVTALPEGELPEAYHELLEYALLASEIDPNDPMETAVHKLAVAQLKGTEHLHAQWTLEHEYELTPQLLAMSHLWRSSADKPVVVATKGAPEAIADLCHLGDAERAAISVQVAHLAEQGLRVLGVAKARHQAASRWPAIQHDFDLEWLGLLGLADPLRPEVTTAIAQCRRAGIRVVMITGDHPNTARAIARQAGIDATEILTGQDMDQWDSTALGHRIASVNVFARVKPAQKLKLVEALKAQGEVVAMTGDGVNDAPALKAAHIGIAMGQRGTDVAREAASLVLLQDDFSSIVLSIEMGRRIFTNLRQALTYTLAVHVPIIGLTVLPVMLGLPLILAPLHIAFLELIIDPACSIVFEAEPGSQDLMEKPPRSAAQALLPSASIWLSLAQGGLVSAAVMGLYAFALDSGIRVEMARSAAFVMLVAANVALVLSSRSNLLTWRSLVHPLTTASAWVLGGTVLALALVTMIPFLSQVFGFDALSVWQWMAVFGTGLLLMVPFQVCKICLATKSSR